MAASTDSSLVLVTGATGFIASHIIKQLQEQGYRVRGSVRNLQDEEKTKRLNELCPEAEHKLELVEADLTKPESWEAAVKDVKNVIHVASPFPAQSPKDENELVQPAVEGTQAILKACVQAKSVKRVVVTSSSVAVAWGPASLAADPNKVFTEEDWTDVEKLDAYAKSKALAEKAAWDYVKELPDEDKIELAVINPAYVMGPVINGSQCTSLEVVKRLLEREKPFCAKLNFAVADVRDVAAAHIKAMTLDEAAGKRHLIVSQNAWMKEMAQILAKEFKPQGYNVPTANCPNPILWMTSLFDKTIKMIMPNVGKVYKYDNSRMKDVLGITPKELKETLVDMAYSLIESGLVKKTKKYKGPNAGTEGEGEEENKEGEEKKEDEDEKPKENGDVKEGGDNEDDDLKKEDQKIEDVEKEDKKDESTDEKKEEKTEEKAEEKSEEKTEEKTEDAPTEEKKE